MELPVQKESFSFLFFFDKDNVSSEGISLAEVEEFDLFIQKKQSVALIPERENSLSWEASKKGSFTVS